MLELILGNWEISGLLLILLLDKGFLIAPGEQVDFVFWLFKKLFGGIVARKTS